MDNLETERIPVWRGNGANEAEIRIAQLPNGEWVAGHSVWLTNKGASSGANMHSIHYPTRQEAIANTANWLIRWLRNACAVDHRTPPPGLIAALNELATPAKLTLF